MVSIRVKTLNEVNKVINSAYLGNRERKIGKRYQRNCMFKIILIKKYLEHQNNVGNIGIVI
jgi:hypothetical protein